MRRLLQGHGPSLLSAVALLAEVGDIALFDTSKQLVSYAGPAMVNRTDTPLMKFYHKKKREQGAGTAICATARKLLTIIFVPLKKELDYWYLEERLYNRKLRALKAAA